MGFTHLRIEIANPAGPTVWEEVEFLIDSGATASVVPAQVLDKLGIKPLGERDFRLASGQTIRRKIGAAAFRYEDRVAAAEVIFGEEGDYTLLGVLTLEALGFALDPLKRELRPLPMILARLREAPS